MKFYFFLFHALALKKMKTKNDYIKITLEYLGKYKPVIEKRKPLEKLFEDIPLTQFGKDITDFGLIKYFFKTYWKVVKKIETKEKHPLCLLYLGNNILLISVENLIKIYDIDKDKEINSINSAQNGINDLLKIDQNKIMISSKDKTIKLFQFTDDYINMNCLQTIEIHKNEVNETINLKSNNYYASCSDDKTIKIWELKNEGYGLKGELIGNETAIKSIFSLPNNEIVSASRGKFIKFWNYEQCLKTLEINYEKCLKSLEISDYPLYKCISLLDDSIISIGTNKSIIFINFIKKEKIKKVFLDFYADSMLNLFGNLIFAFNNSEKSSLEEYTIYHNNIETNIECIGNGKELNILISYIEAIDKNTIATSNVYENFVYLWERTAKKPDIFKNKGFRNEQQNIKCENIIQLKTEGNITKRRITSEEFNEKLEIPDDQFLCPKCDKIPEILSINADNGHIELKCMNHGIFDYSIDDYFKAIKVSEYNYLNTKCKNCNKVQKNEEKLFKYCFYCKADLCEACVNKFTTEEIGHHQNHLVTCIPVNKKNHRCREHPNSIFTEFCFDCQENVCLKEKNLRHIGHKVISLAFLHSEIEKCKDAIIQKNKILSNIIRFNQILLNSYEKFQDNYFHIQSLINVGKSVEQSKINEKEIEAMISSLDKIYKVQEESISKLHSKEQQLLSSLKKRKIIEDTGLYIIG